MATLDDILNLGNIPLTDPVTNRLPPDVEATLPAAVGRGLPNGVAALNAQGKPIDSQGNVMAVVGTTTGTAADAAATTAALATKASTASPALTGTPTVPTAAPGTSTTQAASTAFVAAAVTAVATIDTSTLATKDSPTFTGTVTVPTPVASGAAAPKSYVDTTATAAAATAVKVTGDQAVSGIKTFNAAPVVPDGSFAPAKVAGLTTSLAAKADLVGGLIQSSQIATGAVLRVFKSGSTWPARPTARTDVYVEWIGADPSPPQVLSGTGGMLTGDTRRIPAA